MNMADKQDADYNDHLKMWHTFVRLTTISAVSIAVLLVILAATLL